jgi:hypothetical protein
MGAVLYLSFVLLVYCLSRAARSCLEKDPAAMDPAELPESVWNTLHRAARGITVTEARVRLCGEAGLRYRIRGVMPDGRRVELDIHHDGTAYRRDRPSPPLPDPAGRV